MSENEQCNSNSHFSTCCSNTSSEIDEIDDPLNYASFNDFDSILPLMINGVKIQRVTWDLFSAPPNVFSQWKAHCFWTVGYTYDIAMKKMKHSNNIRYRLTINAWCCLNSKSWVKNKWDRLLEHETGHYLIGCLCALEFKARFYYSRNASSQINIFQIFCIHIAISSMLSQKYVTFGAFSNPLCHFDYLPLIINFLIQPHFLVQLFIYILLIFNKLLILADKSKFTKNYRLESNKIFQDTFQEYLSLERRYDEETNHSQNISKQKEWNEFIIKELQKY